MKMREVIRRCVSALPQTETWEKAKGEPYGAYNISEQDMDKEVKNILFAVTATQETEDYFHMGKFDLLITHHPYQCAKTVPQLIFHTALDCGEGGLNDMWADYLEIKNRKHFDGSLGWYGDIKPMPWDDFKKKIEAFIGSDIQGFCKSEVETIKSVCICTGLGGLVAREAAKTKADCYIFGEGTSGVENYNFPAIIETGHTASERMGIEFFDALFADEDIDIQLAPIEIDYFADEIAHTYTPKTTWSMGNGFDRSELMTYRPDLNLMMDSNFGTEPRGHTKISANDKSFDSPYKDFDPDKHVIDPREDEDCDFGITIIFKDGTSDYIEEFENYEIQGEYFLVHTYDEDRGITRIHRYFRDTIKKIEEDLF